MTKDENETAARAFLAAHDAGALVALVTTNTGGLKLVLFGDAEISVEQALAVSTAETVLEALTEAMSAKPVTVTDYGKPAEVH